MGNHHSAAGSGSPKVPDKLGEPPTECIVKAKSSRGKVLCNTPYLNSMFGKLAKQSQEEGCSIGVSQKVFENAFNGPLRVLGKLLFTHIRGANSKSEIIHLNEFLAVASEVLSLVTTTQHLNYYFQIFSEHKDYLTIEDVFRMVQVCLGVALTAAFLPYNQTDDHVNLLRALASSMMGGCETLSREEFVNWSSKNIPQIFNGVHSFLNIRLSSFSAQQSDDWLKRMSQGNLSPASLYLIATLSKGTSALTQPSLWLLSCSLPSIYLTGCSSNGNTSLVPNFLISKLQQLTEQNAWTLLYNSDQNGLSINRFEHHVFSYKGPSIMMITFDGNLYALATDMEWRESTQFWGKTDTVLVQLYPRFSIIDTGKIIFLNHHARGCFKGIQVGSNVKNPVLKIVDMSTVVHNGVELSLQQIEVWGCASSDIRDIQIRQKVWERKEVEKIRNRKLKPENWDDNPDRMLLNWAGVSRNHAEQVGTH